MISLGGQNKNTYIKIKMVLILSILNTVVNKINDNGFSNQQIHILAWTTAIYPPLLYMVKERMQKCKFKNCVVTKLKFVNEDVKKFDALLFDIVELSNNSKPKLPKYRSNKQKYIFVSREPPILYPLSTAYNQVFNLTWTYRLDSDITLRYLIIKDMNGKIIGPKRKMDWMDVKKMRPISKKYKRKLKNKRKAAAWFVSNCDAPSGHTDYVTQLLSPELDQYQLEVDVYGYCGDQKEYPNDTEQYHAVIESEYYFYLAFENSICEDYVTEKVLTATKHFAVPIVFGGADYTRFLPPGSYLNARVLGPKNLAYIINDTINNKNKYYDFFKWHRYYSLHDPSESPETDEICALCTFLNEQKYGDFKTSVYDITEFFKQ